MPVTAIDLQREQAQNSPALAVDPTDGRFVVAASRMDGPEFDCALHVSGDGGRSWLSADPVTELPEGADRCYAPEIVFDPGGRLYFLFVGLHGLGNAPMGVFLVTSDDRGQTFSAPEKVLGGDRYMVRLAYDAYHGPHGRLHLVWVEATSRPPVGGFGPPPNPVMAAHSDDGGASWSQPVQVSDPDRDRVVAPAVVVDRDGAVHVAYYDLQDDRRNYQGLEGPVWEGTWSLVVSSSLDAGQSFTRHSPVDDEIIAGERVMLIFTTPAPALAVDRDGGLFAAWTDARHGDRDVLLRRSLDGGDSWQPVVRVNDDRIGNGRDQHLPQLDVGPDGRVDVVFSDRRDDPDNVRQHLYYAYSTDAGGSFTPNARVTAEASDTRTGPRYPIPSARGLVEFGSRQAVVSLPSGVLAAWTDTRLPFQGLLHQDVFATQLTVPTSGRTWPQGWLLLAGLGVGGVLVLLGRLRRRREPRGVAPPVAATVAAVVGLTVGCAPTNAGDTDTAPLPPSAPTVHVTLDEYRFDLPDDLPTGRVVFEVVNAGEREHELVLVGIPEDFPSRLAEQFEPGADRQAFPTLVHLGARRPGGRGVFAMDLRPGRYGLICFVEDPDGRQHAHKGMSAEFRVG